MIDSIDIVSSDPSFMSQRYAMQKKYPPYHYLNIGGGFLAKNTTWTLCIILCELYAAVFTHFSKISSFPQFSLIFPSFPQCSLVFPSFPQCSLVFPSFPQFSLVFPNVPYFSLLFPTFPQFSLVFPSVPQCSLVFPSFPYFSLVFPSFP